MNEDLLVVLSDPEGSGLYNKVTFLLLSLVLGKLNSLSR